MSKSISSEVRSISAGVLHSSVYLLELLRDTPLSAKQLTATSTQLLVCPSHIVLNLSLRCGWVECQDDGQLAITKSGRILVEASSYQDRIRRQIADFVAVEQPSWAKVFTRGRKESLPLLPVEIRQVLREAELMESPPTAEVVAWWDAISAQVRSAVNIARTDTGRNGERLSIEKEKVRTGREPTWQSVESNLSGYDVLSVVDSISLEALRIEVKATLESLHYASFFLTRNEWDVATSSAAYRFDLWVLRDGHSALGAELAPEDVAPHVAHDLGTGNWTQIKIPFKTFSDRFKEQA